MNVDQRGSFTELLKTEKCGQFSVNISKPGITKGQHWHNSKWELFIVVSGKGLIEQRRIGDDEVLRFEVSGEKIEAVNDYLMQDVDSKYDFEQELELLKQLFEE